MSPIASRLASAALGVVLLAGCGLTPGTGGGAAPAPAADRTVVGSGPNASSVPAPAPETPPAPAPVVLTTNVGDGTKGVPVDTVLTARAEQGTVTAVAVRYTTRTSSGTDRGKLRGRLSADQTTWTATERLEPNATYEVELTGRNASDDRKTVTTSAFRTARLSLDRQTYPTLQPADGSTVGIGMPVVLTFDVAVRDRAAFERRLSVTSRPAQEGTWSWFSDTEVHYRPKAYWKPGTEVEVTADLNSVPAGGGVYGQKSASTSFTVGRSQITEVDLAGGTAKVYRRGELARTIPVSGGKPGWVTRSGTKLVMAKETNKVMTNEAIGAKEDYRLLARHALRVTWSGEFLHSAPWNAAHLGRRNASHGCVGMSNADAAWLYERTLVGDPVVTTGTRRGLERGNGWTDWDVSYAAYAKGSAL